MPKALERKLKEEYGATSKVPYKVMNKMGVMKGKVEKHVKKHGIQRNHS